ncbi:MAG: RHS repeat-associated core domain-containing protein, partial [Terriglobia bacterium]
AHAAGDDLRATECLKFVYQNFYLTNQKILLSSSPGSYNQAYQQQTAFSGFMPYHDSANGYSGSPASVWQEGTWGMILVLLRLHNVPGIQSYFSGVIAGGIDAFLGTLVNDQSVVRSTTGNGSLLGYSLAARDLPWEFEVWPMLAPTAWFWITSTHPDALLSDGSSDHAVTAYSYDALDNLTGVTQGGQTRTFIYDSLSRLTSTTNPESGNTTYTYDANGNVQTKKDARNITTTYAYDASNRLSSKTYSDGTPTASFFYDQPSVSMVSWSSGTLTNTDGRLTEAATGSTQTGAVYSYDPMGRISSFWQCSPYNCGSSAWKVAYNYDPAGDVTSWTHPDGFTITNQINAAQQVAQIASSLNDATHPGTLATISYTPWGAEQTIEDGCAGSGCTNALETYAYNKRLEPVMIELGTPSNPSADYCVVYNYYASLGSPGSCATPSQGGGNNGNVTGYFYQDNVNPSLSHTAHFGYDGENRLARAQATGSSTYNLTFAYDPYGNMTCHANPQTQGPCPTYSFNPANNRITNSGFSYDASGDLTNDGTHSYQYDAEGRMKSADNGSTRTVDYFADGLQADWKYSAAELDFLRDQSGPALGTLTSGAWSDMRVLRNGERFASYAGGKTTFFHVNSLQSETMRTTNTGSVSSDRLYYPWGQGWGATAGIFAGIPEWDGRMNHRAAFHRNYPDYLGRWLSPDPAGTSAVDLSNPQTWNAYSYAGNSPTAKTDPSGLYTASCSRDTRDCNKQVANFNNSLLSALKSKIPSVRGAAAAYGKLGEKNGVNVTLENQADPKHANVVGQTTTSPSTGGLTYDPATGKLQQATQVTIKANLRGTELEETAIHEGSHVEDRAAFVSSINGRTGAFNRSLNI